MSPAGHRLLARVRARRTSFFILLLCLVLCAVMLAPLVAAILASFKNTAEAAAVPPTYFPHALSLDSYRRLWDYQHGLPTYLGNSLGAALLTILLCLALTIPAGYAFGRYSLLGKEALFVLMLLALIVPYQALLTPIFFIFARLHLTNSLLGLAILHTVIQFPFSIYIMRNSFESVPLELEEAAVIDGGNSWQLLTRIYVPMIRPAIITVALFAFITSWNELLGALVMMNRGDRFTLPLVLALSRSQTSIGGTDWGMLQAGITVSIIPCILFYVLLQKYYVSGLLSGAIK